MSLPEVRMSVRAVVETTLHDSDLCPAGSAMLRMREGTVAHHARQSAAQEEERVYRAEVALHASYRTPELVLRVSGRADGILTGADGAVIIEEIKLGAADAPLLPAHRAQAAFYGHMLCEQEGLEGVRLRVVYVDVGGAVLSCYEEEMGAPSLHALFDELCAPAAKREAQKLARRQARDASLAALAFPFGAYREGQRRFAANVYVAIRERKRLFAQAPTGIGKTMAALYPALRAVGEGLCGRVLFLTARTTGRRSAMDAMARIQKAGAQVMAVEIAAKDKVCPRAVRDCRPEVCDRAKGFYDRLPQALGEAADGGLFGSAQIAELAERYALCPFELSLELARLADVVVGDYNYVYDPFVALDGLLQMPGGAALLVDEAHQLAPRVQDGHSAVADEGELRALRREAGRAMGRTSGLYRALGSAIRALYALAEDPAFESGRLEAPPQALCSAMEAVQEQASRALALGGGMVAAQAFSLATGWCFASGRFCERYAVLTEGAKRHARVRLLLLCAAPEILARAKRARGTVYFSATLAPFDAARRMLGSAEGDACLSLPSPFDPQRLQARIAPIDLRYAFREQTAPQVAKAILEHLQAHAGHALICFPSYAYMARIAAMLKEAHLEKTQIALEARAMGEDEKNALLSAFDRPAGECRMALCCVLGGAFSEGIDLAGDRLQNVIIVSTGLPQPDARVRAMQQYHQEQGEDGFFLCMTLPGMVRVMQAAGRLIRTEQDSGALLLIDSRFCAPRTRALLRGTLVGDALGL